MAARPRVTWVGGARTEFILSLPKETSPGTASGGQGRPPDYHLLRLASVLKLTRFKESGYWEQASMQ
jgi:hypothetical protein